MCVSFFLSSCFFPYFVRNWITLPLLLFLLALLFLYTEIELFLELIARTSDHMQNIFESNILASTLINQFYNIREEKTYLYFVCIIYLLRKILFFFRLCLQRGCLHINTAIQYIQKCIVYDICILVMPLLCILYIVHMRCVDFFIIFSERDVVFSLMFFIKLKRKKSTEIYSIHNIQLLIFHCKVLRECVLSGELAVSVVSRSISLCIFFRFKLFFKLANVWIVNKQDVFWFFLHFIRFILSLNVCLF